MTEATDPPMGKLIVLIALFTLIGIPMVAFLWEVLNRVLAGYYDPIRIGIAVPVLLIWLYLLRLLARQVQRLTA